MFRGPHNRPHYHILVTLKTHLKCSWIHPTWFRQIWMTRLQPLPGDSLLTALRKYLGYIYAKSSPFTQHGNVPDRHQEDQQKGQGSLKMAVILDRCRRGERFSKLTTEFPTMLTKIAQIMRFYPPWKALTYCLYIWGPPGTGKSIQVKAALDAVATTYPHLDTYVKMGALDKF